MIRLLILDDEPAIGESIAAIAAGAGVATRYTIDPRDFLATAGIWEPTHIALDLVMPSMDGIEVLSRLAKDRCQASIILISGVEDRVLDAATRSAKEQGLLVAGVLPKPFSAATLRALLTKPEMPKPYRVPDEEELRHGRTITPAELRRAIETHQLRIYYQPKVECKTGKLAGFEALVRWMHPEHGIMLPDSFVPLAEANGMTNELTAEVLAQALEWFSGYTASGFPRTPGTPPRLSVNISAQDLEEEFFVESVTKQCARYGVEPGRIAFELTETCAMKDPVQSLAMLTRLRMKGFHLAIDDFGTGFSSILQLTRMPFSEIKIDKSFVTRTTISDESRTVIKSIVDLGRSLGLQSTAEGVDDESTLQFLRGIGCDLAQGYLIGRPTPGRECRHE